MEVEKIIYLKSIHFTSENISNSQILKIEQNKNSQFCFILKYLNLQNVHKQTEWLPLTEDYNNIADDVISSSEGFQWYIM